MAFELKRHNLNNTSYVPTKTKLLSLKVLSLKDLSLKDLDLQKGVF